VAENIVKSVDKTLQIVELFLESNEVELSLTDISNKLGIHKSTIHGILATLRLRGFIDQNPSTEKYLLGMKFFELGIKARDNMDLATIARPYLKELVVKYEETVHLVIFNKTDALYVDKVETPRTMRMCSQVGTRVLMHCTGVGKSILAYLPKEQARQIVMARGLEKFTPTTICDEDELFAELARVREQGYSIDNEEIEEGLQCVAAPILNHNGNVIGAISVAGPSTRMSVNKENIIPSLKEVTRAISIKIGYKPS